MNSNTSLRERKRQFLSDLRAQLQFSSDKIFSTNELSHRCEVMAVVIQISIRGRNTAVSLAKDRIEWRKNRASKRYYCSLIQEINAEYITMHRIKTAEHHWRERLTERIVCSSHLAVEREMRVAMQTDIPMQELWTKLQYASLRSWKVQSCQLWTPLGRSSLRL